MRERLGLDVALASICGFSCLFAVASAQADTVDDGYFAAKLMLGVAGEADVEVDGVPGSIESDLELTYGAGVQYMHPLHEHFSLGGQVALRSWQTEAGDAANADRNLLLDVSLVPAGRVAIDHDAELYLAVPVGLALDFWGDDEFAGGAGEVSTGIGLSVAFMLGARFALSTGFGLLGELGYELHSFTHEVEVAGVSGDADVSMGQLAINLGVFFY
jgi:hypothetical protein